MEGNQEMSAEYLADIPQSLAVAAFNGTSFDPERRGESYRNDYAQTMAADYAKMQQQSEKGGTVEQLAEEFARYREGYCKRYRAWLASHSRCISSFITGPSNFPTRMAEKRNNVADKRMREIIDFRERGMKAAIRNLRPDLRPIMSGDDDAVTRLQAEIEQHEAAQARMKAANALLRKHAKAGTDAQIMALSAAGFSDRQAGELVTPDFMGRIGFPGYALTNNTANIRRLKSRLEQIVTAKETPATEAQGDGVRIEDCPADNRVRLFFDGKPDADIRGRLKSSGFRWSPTIGAWQAYRNDRAMSVARSFVAA